MNRLPPWSRRTFLGRSAALAGAGLLPLPALAGRDIGPAALATMRSEARRALVIGNQRYRKEGWALSNPIRDAGLVADVLEKVGFTVTRRKDLGTNDMRRAIIDFGQSLAAGGVGLFYYAGHGVEVNKANWLVPVDAALSAPEYLSVDCVDADTVQQVMYDAGNRINLVVLDCCRNNPFSRGAGGLAQLDPRGTLLAYATAPRKTATDAGVYARALVTHIPTSGATVEEVFKSVRQQVVTDTHDAQRPWDQSDLLGEFYFVLPGEGVVFPGEDEEVLPPPPEPTTTEVFEVGGVSFVMRRIEKGSFLMGSPEGEKGQDSDEKQHRVGIDRPYWMGATEVTQALYRAVTGKKSPSYFEGNDTCPVENVSWWEAVAFCNALTSKVNQATRSRLRPAYDGDGNWDRTADGFRLPSEEEWEYAARAGTTTRFFWGEDLEEKEIGKFAWYAGNSDQKTHPVATKEGNAWGLHDTSGNVWEWVYDQYEGGSARVLRGGSWFITPASVRVASRFRGDPSDRGGDLGFRLSRSVP